MERLGHEGWQGSRPNEEGEASHLRALEYLSGRLVLRHIEGHRFRVLGDPPPWYREVVRLEEEATLTVDPVGGSLFLANFLVDAQSAWASPGRLHVSGPWTEAGEAGVAPERVFEAAAFTIPPDIELLLVEEITSRHREYAELLQAARDLSIQHRSLDRTAAENSILAHCLVHDLRSPLNGVRLALSDLRRSDTDQRQRELLVELALRQLQLQRSLIDQILEVYQAEEAEPVLDTLDLARVAARAVEDQLASFSRKGIGLVHRLEAVTINADPLRMARVFSNLLENAQRHAPKGSSVEIEVGSAGGVARVEIRDHGPGVPTEIRERLFAKLQQGPRRGKLGLGLYFCRLTIEGLGGRIGYSPRPGGGSIFWFCVPALIVRQ